MRSPKFFFSLVAACLAVQATLFGQVPVISGAGYRPPKPLNLAPGQVITLFVEGVGASLIAPVRAEGNSWPTSLAGISVTFRQAAETPAPIFEVRPIPTCGVATPGNACSTITAITAQIPFELQPVCQFCANPLAVITQLIVSENNKPGAVIDVFGVQDQVHALTSCDILISGGGNRPINPLQCTPMVTHADGSLVSASAPAKAGEELVMYAVGLGQTDPPAVTGKPTSAPVKTATTFNLDFNFHVNALPSMPALIHRTGDPPPLPAIVPLFSGLTPGFTGLYQINFVVPAIPAATTPCPNPSAAALITLNYVHSNLTVSVGSNTSFDGAGICVQP